MTVPDEPSRPAPSPLGASGTEAGAAFDQTLAASGTGNVSDAASAGFAPPRVAPGVRLGSYEIAEKLGEGGMGAVWKARHLKLDKWVALKLLPPQLTGDSASVLRFEREMRAVGAVDHPNIVRAMDAGEIGGLHFLVMEYVDGSDLSKYVRERGPLPIIEACELLSQAALGLAAAHEQGLIHRDIKPSNLLLSRRGQVKLLDLGLARLLAENVDQRQITQSGEVMGTPDYMAPEQWDDIHAVDHRADLYALGCTLCLVLTGRPPFGDDRHTSMGQKMKGHLLEAPPSLRTLRPDVPEPLETLYADLMRKEPAVRESSAAAVAARLRAIAQAEGARAETIANFPARGTGLVDAGAVATSGSDIPAAFSISRQASLGDANLGNGGWTPQPVVRGTAVGRRTRRPVAPFVIAGATTAVVLVAALAFAWRQWQRETNSTAPSEVAAGNHTNSKNSAELSLKREFPAASPTGKITRKPTQFPQASPQGAMPPLPQAPFTSSQALEHQQAWATYLNVPIEWENSLGMRFRLIPPGEFTRGMSQAEADEVIATSPTDPRLRRMATASTLPHRVRITQAFYLGVHEVTQAQYATVVGENPAHFSPLGEGAAQVKRESSESRPVENLGSGEAFLFCSKLCELESLAPTYAVAGEELKILRQDGYRLPTDAQWEWACRGGTTSRWSNGDVDAKFVEAGWIAANSKGATHQVGVLAANPFGLRDMHGNIREWCQDRFREEPIVAQPDAVISDPQGPETGAEYVIRGGFWESHSVYGWSALRGFASSAPEGRRSCGIRIALTIPGQDK